VHFIPAAGCLGREKSIGWCLGESSRAVERPEENDWRESGAEANDRGSGRVTRSLASIYRARFAVGSGKGKNVMAKEAPGRARCGQFLQDVRAFYFSFDFQFSRVVGSPSLPGRANCVPPPFSFLYLLMMGLLTAMVVCAAPFLHKLFMRDIAC
jgi:hypothetical protein